MSTKATNRQLDWLCQDFRRHLEQFYASLSLAPPYDSLEKAIRLLSKKCKKKAPEDLQALIQNPPLKWELYSAIFLESDLSQKHRGIIRGLIESDRTIALPAEYKNFLNAFHSSR